LAFGKPYAIPIFGMRSLDRNIATSRSRKVALSLADLGFCQKIRCLNAMGTAIKSFD